MTAPLSLRFFAKAWNWVGVSAVIAPLAAMYSLHWLPHVASGPCRRSAKCIGWDRSKPHRTSGIDDARPDEGQESNSRQGTVHYFPLYSPAPQPKFPEHLAFAGKSLAQSPRSI